MEYAPDRRHLSTRGARTILTVVIAILVGVITEASVLVVLTVLAWSDTSEASAAEGQGLLALVVAPTIGILATSAITWRMTRNRRLVKIVGLGMLALSVLLLIVFLPGYFHIG